MLSLLTAVLGGSLAGFALWGKRRHRRLLETIEVVTLTAVSASKLGNQRDIIVYLPPGYRDQSESLYDVLYVNDGQEHEALGLRETLARLMTARQIQPIITVAIPTNENRLHEYGTSVALNTLGLGVMAAQYAHFVIEELMPMIDNTFRTRPGAGFLGMSLGGLAAFDIVWNHPEFFAVVGVMSGSFWWRAADDEKSIDPGRRIANSIVRRTTQVPSIRLWFQAGTRDEVCDRDGDGVIDAIQDTLELMGELTAVGCQLEQMAYVEVVGGRHDYQTWSRVLPDFLKWAFNPRLGRQTG